jgi:hypothetical protein
MKILIKNKNTDKWDVVESAEYRAETELQRLLTESPSLIPVIDILDDASPLVAAVREVGLPGSGSTDILAFNLFSGVQAAEKKLAGTKQWTKERFFEAIETNLDQNVVDISSDIYLWSKNNADKVYWGTGKVTGSFTFHYHLDGRTVSVFSIYTNGQMIVNFGYLSTILDQSTIMTFHRALTAIPTLKHLPVDFKKFPMVKIEDVFVAQPEYVSQFKNAVEGLGRTIKETQEKTISESVTALTN